MPAWRIGMGCSAWLLCIAGQQRGTCARPRPAHRRLLAHPSPPLRSYNTLIDVYGKMGNWEEAVNVLALMKSEGVEPVLRTFKCVAGMRGRAAGWARQCTRGLCLGNSRLGCSMH